MGISPKTGGTVPTCRRREIEAVTFSHSENGDADLVKTSPKRHKDRGTSTPPGPPPRLQGDRQAALAYPVLANGGLFIRDLGTG